MRRIHGVALGRMLIDRVRFQCATRLRRASGELPLCFPSGARDKRRRDCAAMVTGSPFTAGSRRFSRNQSSYR
jgi:hypothetical protein